LLRIPSLIDSVSGALQTNFDPASVLPAAMLGASLDRSSIASEVMYPCGGDTPRCELRGQNSPGGVYLFPDPALVSDPVARIFYAPRLRRGAATVEVRAAPPPAASALAERLSDRAFNASAGPSGPTGVGAGAAAGATAVPAGAKTAVLLRNGGKRYTS